MSICKILMIFLLLQGLKSELENFSPSIGQTALDVKQSGTNTLPRSGNRIYFICLFVLRTFNKYTVNQHCMCSRYLMIKFVSFFGSMENFEGQFFIVCFQFNIIVTLYKKYTYTMCKGRNLWFYFYQVQKYTYT